MAIGTLRALARSVVDAVHGVPIVITRSDDADSPVSTTGTWLPDIVDDQPYGHDFNRLASRKVMLIARTATLSSIPKGSTIQAADADDSTVRLWRVEGYAAPVRYGRFRVVLQAQTDTV